MKKVKPGEMLKALLSGDFFSLQVLAKEMERMRLTVKQFPEDIEYTQEDVGVLESVRHEALKLADECEVAIKTFESGTPSARRRGKHD